MAQIVSKSDRLAHKYRLFVRIFWCFTGASALGMVLWLIFLINWDRPGLGLLLLGPLVFCAFALLAKLTYDKMHVLAAGLKGESATNAALKQLDDEYWLFSNLTVTYKNRTSELDHVIVGPGGLFVLESKHLSGKITGAYDDKKWLREKQSRAGVLYSQKIYSPRKQVGTHVYRLANVLRSNGFSTEVTGAVYFSNPQTQIFLQDMPKDAPLFFGQKGADAMLSFFRKGPQPLTPQQVYHLAQFLCEL